MVTSDDPVLVPAMVAADVPCDTPTLQTTNNIIYPAPQTCSETEQSRQSEQGTIYAGPQHSACLAVSHQAAVFLSTLLLLLVTLHSPAGGHCTLRRG